MATIMGRDNVARPGPDAGVLPYGLFTVANGPLDLTDHASGGGLDFQSPYCKSAQGYAVACPPGTKAASLTGGYTTVNGDPFVVLAGSECGAMSGDENRNPDQYTRDLVTEALRSQEQRLVESVLSAGGGVAAAPSLVTGGTQQASANVVEAFSELEAAYAPLYGLPAVLHVPIMAMSAVMNAHLVEKDNRGIWRTGIGNAVNFGNYTGASQAGVVPAAPATNIYITGQVTVWRNDIWVSPWAESIDKTTNQIHRFAERTYVVTYECTSIANEVASAFVCC